MLVLLVGASSVPAERVTAHSSGKYTFEGVWVQGEPSLEGYFFVERTGSYEDGKEKSYKYKLSAPVRLSSSED